MTAGTEAPFTGQQALAMAVAGLDYLKSPQVAQELGVAGCGEMLRGLAQVDSKVIAARAVLAGVFAAGRGYESDGYGGLMPWLVNVTRVTKAAARDTAAWVNRTQQHPVMAQAMGDGALSESWMRKISVWIGKLPEDGREAAEEILVRAALAGVGLKELQLLAAEMYERSRTTPDKDPGDDNDGDDGFDDRYLAVGTTFGGAARLTGDLTPECAAALQAVLDALGKRRGGQDTRTIGQRYHDALEEAARLLIRADMVPGRAGQDTQVQLHIPFSTLRGMDGASVIEQAWLAAKAGQPDYVTGPAGEAAACDATLITVVTGHPDWAVVDQIIELALDRTGREKSRALTDEEWRALRYAIAQLAMDFCSGPAGIAAMLRAGLLNMPYAAKSLPMDVGCADSIPPHIRRAVMLRDRHCQFPSGCWVPGAQCHVHHLVHRSRGGKTSIKNCVLLCSYHHQVMVHRMGWELTLNADGTTEAKGPDGQIVRSHSPPPRPG